MTIQERTSQGMNFRKVRNRFKAQTGVAQGFGGSQGQVSVAEKRLMKRLPQAARSVQLPRLAKAGPGQGLALKVRHWSETGLLERNKVEGVGGRGKRKGGEKHNVTQARPQPLPLCSWGCACYPPIASTGLDPEGFSGGVGSLGWVGGSGSRWKPEMYGKSSGLNLLRILDQIRRYLMFM